MTSTSLPITERSNELTEDIDILEKEELLRIFRQSDGQLFSGWRQFTGLYDKSTLNSLEELSSLIEDVIGNGSGTVVFSGAGTSGRLAFFCSRIFNNHLQLQRKPRAFEYLIAGGDKALFTAQELSEDDVVAAIQDLQSIEKKFNQQEAPENDKLNTIIYVGITCGLSAPYVASQLEYAMNYNANQPNSSIRYVPVLLGFSPVAYSRNVPIEKWEGKTFFQIASRLEQLAQQQPKQYFIVNPVVGPETVTGSTRMKGGSATKILLEALFIRAISRNQPQSADSYSSIVEVLQAFEKTCREAYISITSSLWPMVKLCGDSLSGKGRLHYLSEHPSFGILSLIDASECPPTFGASIDDVKAYFASAWDILNNNDGNLSRYEITTPATRFTATPEESKMFHIDLYNNPELKVANIDTVVMIQDNPNVSEASIQLLKGIKQTGAKIGLVIIEDVSSINKPVQQQEIFDCVFRLPLNQTSFLRMPFFGELALKYSLNTISTGAHILKGKILKNRMIDVRVSNAKLFDRSLRIIAQFAKTDEEVARQCLLRSIYHTDALSQEVLDAPVSRHIECGFRQDKIVPRAILLATGKFTFEQAVNVLNAQPIVRKVLLELERDQ